MEPDCFRALGIALIAGREFSPSDAANTPKVAIVNETFVRKFLGGGNSLGRRLKVRENPAEIVGAVSVTKYSSVKDARRAVFHTAQRRQAQQNGCFSTRGGGATRRIKSDRSAPARARRKRRGSECGVAA